MESVILHMILYPEAKKKAQAELDAVIGKDRLPVLGDRPELPYTTAFLMVQCPVLPNIRLTHLCFRR